MAYKANFKTGWNQREIPAMMKVTGDGRVGYLYEINEDTLTILAAEPTADKKYAMLAQSDSTLGYGHVPVENRNYQYSDEVKASATPKLVAYFIVDITDINYTEV